MSLTTAQESRPKQTIYFAYGSNLSTTQMLERCPASRPLGLARLPGWKWLINERGYANVVQLSPSEVASKDGEDIGVWGVLFALGNQEDEDHLDRCEGVPYAYTREDLVVEVDKETTEKAGVKGGEVRWTESKEIVGLEALVYVDRKRTGEAKPRGEYVLRMNRGIEEATKMFGLPGEYVDKVTRRFIPAP